jgi:hypothetical protein
MDKLKSEKLQPEYVLPSGPALRRAALIGLTLADADMNPLKPGERRPWQKPEENSASPTTLTPKPPEPKPNQNSPQSQEPELTPAQKLQAAQQESDLWNRVAHSPKLSPKAAAWAKGIARSLAAEVKLRKKAVAFSESVREKPLPQPVFPVSNNSKKQFDVEEVLGAYGELLQNINTLSVYDISSLPVPKREMKEAIKLFYASTTSEELKKQSETAFMCLFCFQDGVGANPLEFNTDPASVGTEKWLLRQNLRMAESEVLLAEWKGFRATKKLTQTTPGTSPSPSLEPMEAATPSKEYRGDGNEDAGVEAMLRGMEWAKRQKQEQQKK